MRISHDDLMRLSLRCQRCTAETIIDLHERKHFTEIDTYGQLKIKWRVGDRLLCPVCQQAFQSPLTKAIQHLIYCFDAIEESKENVGFRISGDRLFRCFNNLLNKPT